MKSTSRRKKNENIDKRMRWHTVTRVRWKLHKQSSERTGVLIYLERDRLEDHRELEDLLDLDLSFLLLRLSDLQDLDRDLSSGLLEYFLANSGATANGRVLGGGPTFGLDCFEPVLLSTLTRAAEGTGLALAVELVEASGLMLIDLIDRLAELSSLSLEDELLALLLPFFLVFNFFFFLLEDWSLQNTTL